jgi:hypothetical protein
MKGAISWAGQARVIKPLARLGGVARRADGGDHLVHVRHGDGEAAQDVRTLARAAQFERGAARHDLLAEVEEGGQEASERQSLGPAAVERQHVAGEVRLHGREAPELVEDHVGRRVALELDDHAHAVAVGLVLNVGDALDALVARGLGDAVDHRGLVDLVGDGVDDDGLPPTHDLVVGLGAQDHGPAPLEVRLPRARAAEHDAARGEVGAGDVLDQVLRGQVRVLDEREAGVDHLAKVVRRDVGGHADGDAARAVDQHVGKARGQDRGLAVLAVVVVLEVDRVLVDVGHEERGRLVHAHLGIAHGGRVVAVHGPEVALPVEERQRHGEVLGHARQRLVDGRVAVGVVLAHDVPHGARALAVGLVGRVARVLHGEEDAPVHGLEPVAQVGNRAGDDHAHGVVEVGGLHLRLDGDGRVAARRGDGRVGRVGHAGCAVPRACLLTRR